MGYFKQLRQSKRAKLYVKTRAEIKAFIKGCVNEDDFNFEMVHGPAPLGVDK